MAEGTKKIRLVHITTVPQSLGFLTGQVGYMKARGFEVHALSSPGSRLDRFAEREQVLVYSVKMYRTISPLRDLVSIFQLWRQLRRVRAQIVQAHMSKAGLLGMTCAWLAGIPIRIYHSHGMALFSAKGYKHILLRLSEKVSCMLAHRVLCVSHSVRRRAVAEGLCQEEKIKVLLNGSINGVDAAGRFNPEYVGEFARQETRSKYDIPAEALVVGFVGRIFLVKGLVELAAAWKTLREEVPNLHLLVVGSFDPRDPVPPDVEELLRTDPRIHLTGRVDNTLPLYAVMDLFLLPSLHEGMPTVILEASAMELPVVATRIPGCVDAVFDGVTGTLVPPRDAAALADAIRTYLNDPELRRRHGQAGRERVLRDFRPEAIWEAHYQEYVRLLQEKGLPVPKPVSDGEEAVSAYQGLVMTHVIKRMIDLTASLAGLAVLTPLLAAVAAMIRLEMGPPVFFRQVRPGLHGHPFTLLKFRTMTDACDVDGRPLPAAERLTRLGSFLRKTSMDELPGLWNVLKGRMSLVGPRPLLVEYLDRYNSEQARRHEVKPGVTGWAQVNGRNALTWEEKFELDVWYVDHQSLWLDLKILFMTFVKVFKREGISQDGQATMERFTGTVGNHMK